MRILQNNTLILALDIQSKLFPVISDNEKLLIQLKKLFYGAKVLKLPFLVTEQYSKALGNTLSDLQDIIENEYLPLEKSSFSCMDDESFVKNLEESGKKNIIIGGIESHVCVLQTAIDMKSAGYNPIVIADAVSSRNPYDKKIALKRMRDEGVIFSTVESILFELQRYSGNDSFKAISKIIK